MNISTRVALLTVGAGLSAFLLSRVLWPPAPRSRSNGRTTALVPAARGSGGAGLWPGRRLPCPWAAAATPRQRAAGRLPLAGLAGHRLAAGLLVAAQPPARDHDSGGSDCPARHRVRLPRIAVCRRSDAGLVLRWRAATGSQCIVPAHSRNAMKGAHHRQRLRSDRRKRAATPRCAWPAERNRERFRSRRST